MSEEKLDKMIDEIENRPYQEYDDEALDQMYDDVLTDEEKARIEGRGFFNKIRKFFRDINDAFFH